MQCGGAGREGRGRDSDGPVHIHISEGRSEETRTAALFPPSTHGRTPARIQPAPCIDRPARGGPARSGVARASHEAARFAGGRMPATIVGSDGLGFVTRKRLSKTRTYDSDTSSRAADARHAASTAFAV